MAGTTLVITLIEEVPSFIQISKQEFRPIWVRIIRLTKSRFIIYYHPDICEAPDAIPFPPALAQETLKQPLTAQVALPLPKASKGPSQAGDQGQGADGAKDKGKGKGTKPPLKAKDAAKAKEAEAQAKEVEAKTKEADPMAKDAFTFQLSQKEDPPPPKAKA